MPYLPAIHTLIPEVRYVPCIKHKGMKLLTEGSFLELGVVNEIIGVCLGQDFEVIGLVFIQSKGLHIQAVSLDVFCSFFEAFISHGMETIESLRGPA